MGLIRFNRTLTGGFPFPSNAVRIAMLGFVLCAVAACAQPGVPLWTNRYDGLGNGDDQAYAVAVDKKGGVFVTGASFRTNSNYDYATIAYSSAGMPLWTNHFGGPGNDPDYPWAVVSDGTKAVFVTGGSWSGASAIDYATVAYSIAGVPLWTNRYDGPGNNSDEARAVAVGGSGNVIVTGYSVGTNGSFDYATIAYSSTGLPLWTNRYNGPGNSDDFATALTLSGSSNVFVTGYSYDGIYPDYATIAYSDDGTPLWTNRYNGPGNSTDSAIAVAVDGRGDAIVTGFSTGLNGSWDYATIAYSSAGVPLWTNRYDGPANSHDPASSIAVDGVGNVFVTGYSTISANSSGYATINYSCSGVPMWTNLYSGQGDSYNTARAVALDSGGNVFVTGNSHDNGSSVDYTTIAYSNAGFPFWTNRYDGPGHGQDIVSSMTVDANGDVTVTGYSTGTNGSYDYATIKYSGFLSPIPLSFQVAGERIVLSWTKAAFNLQSANAVQGIYTNISGATSPYTNLISGDQQYFRLIGN